MIDTEGFRSNVGIIVANHIGQLLWARRIGGQDAWQFPQGGMDANESLEQTLYRELDEEIGLTPEDVKIIDVTKGWLRYRLPKRFVRNHQQPQCLGQKQKWFLLELLGDESTIHFDSGPKPEFDSWQWVSYWYPLACVVSFKRDVYRRALKELVPAYNTHFASVIAEREQADMGAAC